MLNSNLAFTLPRAPTADPDRWEQPVVTGTLNRDRVRLAVELAGRPLSAHELCLATGLDNKAVSYAVTQADLIRTGTSHRRYRYALPPTNGG